VLRVSAAEQRLPGGRRARAGRLPRRFYGWRIVGTLAVTETVSWGVLYYSFAVLQLPMRTELHLSTGTVTGAYSLAVLLTGVAAVPLGRWVDRRGARALMAGGSIAATLLVLAWARVHTALGLYAVFSGIGLVSAAVLYEPAFAVVVRWFLAERSQALLAVTVVAGFASTIFLPLSEALTASVGWRDTLVILAAVLAVTTVLPHAIVLRRDPADFGLHPDGAASSCPAPAAPVTARAAPDGLRRIAAWAWRDRRFRRLALALTANSFTVIVVAVSLVPYLREHGHSARFAAAATGSLGAVSVTGRLVVTGATRRRSTAMVTAAVFAAQALALVLLAAAGSTTLGAVGFVLLFGLGFGVGTIARPALLADAYATTDYATLSALLGVALTAAKTAGPVTAGLVRTATGSYLPVLAVLAGAAAYAAATLARLDRADRPEPPGT